MTLVDEAVAGLIRQRWGDPGPQMVGMVGDVRTVLGDHFPDEFHFDQAELKWTDRYHVSVSVDLPDEQGSRPFVFVGIDEGIDYPHAVLECWESARHLGRVLEALIRIYRAINVEEGADPDWTEETP